MTPGPLPLAGKVAVVTGAGSGIGKAIAQRFAAEGAQVVAASRGGKALDSAVADIRGAGGAVAGVAVDVAQQADVQRMVDQTMARHGRIDILVNNAGVMDDFTPVADVTDDLWRRVLSVNLDGVFYACRLVVPVMARQGGGSIVNVASIGGLQGARAGAAYTASKHAVIGLTKNIAYMYAKAGVRCNAIAPGGVVTNIMTGATPNAFGYERMAAGVGNNIRMGQPEEVAGLALFLASEESSLVNGAVVTADAGWTAY